MHYSLYYPFGCRRTKKDYSTAIMDRKKAPHKLQVEDSKQDDNSIVEMTQAKMDELKIFRGDAVILKGKCVTQTARSSLFGTPQIFWMPMAEAFLKRLPPSS